MASLKRIIFVLSSVLVTFRAVIAETNILRGVPPDCSPTFPMMPIDKEVWPQGPTWSRHCPNVCFFSEGKLKAKETVWYAIRECGGERGDTIVYNECLADERWAGCNKVTGNLADLRNHTCRLPFQCVVVRKNSKCSGPGGSFDQSIDYAVCAESKESKK